MVEVSIVCPIYPTEEFEKVKAAITNLFPDAKPTENNGRIEASSENIEHFAERLRDQNIRNTARQVLLKSIKENKIIFHLNKQTAFVSKINFTDGNSVLGDISVTIIDDDVHSLIDHITLTLDPKEEQE